MAFDQETRIRLQRFVTGTLLLLEEKYARQFQRSHAKVEISFVLKGELPC